MNKDDQNEDPETEAAINRYLIAGVVIWSAVAVVMLLKRCL